MNFLKFETDKIDTCIEFMKRLKKEYMQRNGNSSSGNELCVMATGGGAYKYYDRITQELGVEVMREDEMECLIIGMCCPFWLGLHYVGGLICRVRGRTGLLHLGDTARGV